MGAASAPPPPCFPSSLRPSLIKHNPARHARSVSWGPACLERSVACASSYLNQINTQATLLAGCAVGMIGSGELNALEDEVGFFAWPINGVYVTASTICLACSLWVIYTAMNLINLSIHSTLNGETMREIAEADNLIEQRMREVRLVFLTSLAALITAGMAMICQITHWVFTIVGVIVFAFAAWHASKSDEGTVLLYQRYTGLEVKDRFGDRWWDAMRDLLVPFGFGTTQGQYLSVRSKVNVAVSAFMEAGNMKEGSAKYLSKDDHYGDAALKAALAKTHIKKAKLARRQQGAAADKKKGILTPPSSDGSRKGGGDGFNVLEWLGMQVKGDLAEEAKRVSAETIQNVWRAGRVSKSRDEWHGGFMMKTASGAGPIERLKEAWGKGLVPLPSISDLPPSQPRFARWFVINPNKSTLAIYTTPDDHRTGGQCKGEVRDLKGFAVVRLRAPDDKQITLALMPRSALNAPGSGSTPPATPISDVPATPTTPGSPGGVGGAGKSWYLRAKSSQETNDWFHRLSGAGVHAIDSVHDADPPPSSRRGGSPLATRESANKRSTGVFSGRKALIA